jgi:hypothetical protein
MRCWLMATRLTEKELPRSPSRERGIKIMSESETIQRQRAAAMRTVWILAGVALLVYFGFIASGVMAR